MFSSKWVKLGLAGVGLILLAVLIYNIPWVNYRLGWRLDAAEAYVRGVVYPADAAPTPVPHTPTPESPAPDEVDEAPQPSPFPTTTSTPEIIPTDTPGPTPTPIPSPTPLPEMVSLDPPSWEKQDWNNCGPATLSLYLKTFGWTGDQFVVSDLLKPLRNDKNVNIEEMVWYVRNHAGWLNAEFRVGGDIEILKQILAAGLSVVIEEGYFDTVEYYPNDDKWLGHYLLLTGYDEQAQTFMTQDTFLGENREVPYETLDEGWRTFNRVFLMLYLPGQEDILREILGDDWDPDINREHALETARAEVEAAPDDPFAWFNLGNNLAYFEQYFEAADAFDEARRIGLPQRMFRYQFSPFIAYFHAHRTDDLMALTEYALQRTAQSEEAMLWRGWGYIRLGENSNALDMFYQALERNPNYTDAQYAVNFLIGE